MADIDEAPNPGSSEARQQGCTCAVVDNNHGQYRPRPNGWWVTEGCPLHDPDGTLGQG